MTRASKSFLDVERQAVPDTSKIFPPAQDRYSRDVEKVAAYLAQRIVRGRDLRGLIFDCASQFPGLRLSVFCDALRLVHTRAAAIAWGGSNDRISADFIR